ncbi:RelA/SpoT domain-containing protein [Rhizobium sp. RCC_161_2]|uniref:RelA/SpoT domain-containing protein n=1 Tax=Rhizobium sp. RCC_161_2 TaxID=3239219 RepID=UPI00352599DC
MVWATPQYSREQINQAGRALLNPEGWAGSGRSLKDLDTYMDALSVVNNWRASHGYPLNTFQATLRKRARKLDRHCIFATRIKRLDSITKKLVKHEDMKLSQMQDIGGLRAILQNCDQVYKLAGVYEERRLTHELAKINDYIANPKPDGYRSMHFIYRYQGGGRTTHYDGLKQEIQIRSVLQHAWATAVETVGIFTKQALKSSEGDANWLRFFALASSVIAGKEGGADVPGVPGDTRVRDEEFKELARQLNVREVLNTYQNMLRALERHTTKDAKFFLLSLEPEEKRIAAKGFLTRDSITANQQYTEMEKRLAEKPGAQAVLVKVDSVAALRRAYPNYFADTTKFIQAVNEYLPEHRV